MTCEIKISKSVIIEHLRMCYAVSVRVVDLGMETSSAASSKKVNSQKYCSYLVFHCFPLSLMNITDYQTRISSCTSTVHTMLYMLSSDLSLQKCYFWQTQNTLYIYNSSFVHNHLPGAAGASCQSQIKVL